MKFMVTYRPNRITRDSDPSPAVLAKAAAYVKELLENGTIEAAYALHSGGHILIFDAESSEELAVKVRYNPVFKDSATEVVPIEDLVSFLEGMSSHLESI